MQYLQDCDGPCESQRVLASDSLMHAEQAATAVSGLGLQESLAEAGAGTWLALTGAAAGAYCLWEQLKFRIYR